MVGSIVGAATAVIILIIFQQDVADLFGVSSASSSNLSILKDLITPLAASFGGAIAGALTAFKLQNDKESVKREEDEVAALNNSLLALESQLNDLGAIKRQTILNVAQKPIRFLEIRPVTNTEHVTERIDLRMVPGLARLKEAELIQECRLAESRYINVINTLKMRDSIILHIHNSMATAGINTFDSTSLTKTYEILGPNDLAIAYEVTEEYIRILDEALVSVKNAMLKISSIFEKHYKEKGYGSLKIEFPPETEELFRETPPPLIKNVKDLLEKAGHKSKDI
jgi:hypothetical protein